MDQECVCVHVLQKYVVVMGSVGLLASHLLLHGGSVFFTIDDMTCMCGLTPIYLCSHVMPMPYCTALK